MPGKIQILFCQRHELEGPGVRAEDVQKSATVLRISEKRRSLLLEVERPSYTAGLCLNNIYISEVMFRPGPRGPIDLEQFDQTPTSQNDAFDLLLELGGICQIMSATDQFKDGEEGKSAVVTTGVGPKRIEITLKARAGVEKDSLVAGLRYSNLSNSLVLFGRLLSPETSYLLERSWHADSWLLHKVEIFPGGSKASQALFMTSHEEDQRKGWDTIKKFLDSFHPAEQNALRLWNSKLTTATVVADDDEEDAMAAAYGAYSGYSGGYSSGYVGGYSSQYNWSNHRAEFRVAGDDIGAEIRLKRKEVREKKAQATKDAPPDEPPRQEDAGSPKAGTSSPAQAVADAAEDPEVWGEWAGMAHLASMTIH